MGDSLWYEDISRITFGKEIIFTGVDSPQVNIIGEWEDNTKPFALISSELAKSCLDVEALEPGYEFEYGGLKLRIVGFEPQINAWFIEKAVEP